MLDVRFLDVLEPFIVGTDVIVHEVGFLDVIEPIVFDYIFFILVNITDVGVMLSIISSFLGLG